MGSDTYYDPLVSPDEQDDEGTPSLLGASEPQRDISNGGGITSFIKSLSDTAGSASTIYNQFRNPNASAAPLNQRLPVQPTAKPTVTSWLAGKTAWLVGGVVVLVLVLFFMRRGR